MHFLLKVTLASINDDWTAAAPAHAVVEPPLTRTDRQTEKHNTHTHTHTHTQRLVIFDTGTHTLAILLCLTFLLQFPILYFFILISFVFSLVNLLSHFFPSLCLLAPLPFPLSL